MARMRWSILLVATLVVSLIPAGAPSAAALSCPAPDPDEDPIVGTIQIVDLGATDKVIEIPYWTRGGCPTPVDSVPAALHDDWFVFFEKEGQPSGSGALKAIDLATDERHQAVIDTPRPELAIGYPYVYLLTQSRDEPRHLTGYPLLTQDDLVLRTLQMSAETQTYLGTNTFHSLDTQSEGVPRLTTVDLTRWSYIHNDHPLPVSATHHWRLLGGSMDWSLLEQHHEPLRSWEVVPENARIWAYRHTTGDMHEIQIPAKNEDFDFSSEHIGPKDFGIDGNRLYYTIYEPWRLTHLEALTLPYGSPKEVHDGEGLSGARVDDGRLVLFVPSDDNTIPDWWGVKVQRYDNGYNWNELPAAPVVYVVLGVFMMLMIAGVVRHGRR